MSLGLYWRRLLDGDRLQGLHTGVAGKGHFIEPHAVSQAGLD